MKKLIFFLLLISNWVFAQQVESVHHKIFNQFPHVRDFAMTTAQNEIYFTVESYKKEYSYIAFIRRNKKGNWSQPKVASFSGMYKDLEPFLSPNGLTLYFATNRKDNISTEIKKDIDIWYVTRTSLKSKWSEPKNIGSVINTSANEYYPSVTNNGDLFFTAAYKDAKGKEDIYVSRYVNGKYQKPVSLSSAINTEKYEFNAYVAPDESFMIFTSYGRKGSYGGGDLFISFKNKQNQWLPAENLGASINSNKIDFCPFIDLKTNTLYFTSDRSSIQKSFKSRKNIHQLQEILKTKANGLGRMYKVDLSGILNKKRD
jgi:hypothetical protein